MLHFQVDRLLGCRLFVGSATMNQSGHYSYIGYAPTLRVSLGDGLSRDEEVAPGLEGQIVGGGEGAACCMSAWRIRVCYVAGRR